ncbi:MAG TPA: formyl transferase [Flavobacteriales bacterium]|nr:formyl transferase [Flavobacteriales bacterium]
MTNDRVVLLGRENASTALLYHALAREFDTRAVLEQGPSTWSLLRSRIRRLGLFRVFGQVLFQLFIVTPLNALSKGRQREIIAGSGASIAPIPEAAITRVPSVNGKACWEAVRSTAPAVVTINGTRILSARTIAAIGRPILNTHVGMTPRYRGVHGAYWALVNNDRAHCGVTVHLVDEGIDTGGVLYQGVIEPTERDNFTTYPLLQMVTGSALLLRAVRDVARGDPKVIEGPSGDARWYHPTVWQYLRNRIGKGVK